MILDADRVLINTDNPVLHDCLPATRAELAARGHFVPFETDTLLFADGEATGLVVFPLSGSFQMGKATVRGRRQIICNPQAASCGGICMLAFGDTALAEARGLQPGVALMLSRSEFEQLIHGDPVLCRAAWQSATGCMAHLSHLVEQLSFSKVAERVTLALLEGTTRDGDEVRLTQADLAAEVGTTREVVARCLATLQTLGFIRLGRARITVLNRAGLSQHL